MRTPSAIAVQNKVKAQNKKALVVAWMISAKAFALTLKVAA
jgi:hypothetical protein